MEIRVETTKPAEANADWLVVPVHESGDSDDATAALDAVLDGQLTRLREAGDITGKLGETLTIPDAPSIAAGRVLVVGLGKSDGVDVAKLERAMTTAARIASEKAEVAIAVMLPAVDGVEASQAAETTATAMAIGCVGQGIYQEKPSRHPFSSVTLLAGDDSSDLQTAADRGATLAEAVNLTREVVNRTADDIYPETFAKRAEEVAGESGLTIRVLDEDDMQKENMGSLLQVAVGSDRPPRLVILEYKGGDANGPTLGLVGKGVTFDSGGLSLKPTTSMNTMKCDMAGAGTVLGAMSAIAKLKLPVNAIGFMGLVENMVSGRSYKLGDVLHSRSGITIEVLNTDAEGRLVLADVLNYAVDQKVTKMIDLATLTGACVVALGEEIAGAFTNNQEWCDAVLSAAKTAGENLWQMPMGDEFAELLKSDVADCKNVGPRWGGSITAAKFLEKFVGEAPWVHLDIAGPAFADSNKPHREGGATGCLVRTLVEVAAKFEG